MTSVCPSTSLTHMSINGYPELEHVKYLKIAESLARKAALGEKCGDLYGAVLVTKKDGHVIAEGYDAVKIDPTSTAGISAIRLACRLLQTADLSHCVLYLSSYPPLIDCFAISNANIRDVYYLDSFKTSTTVINHTTYHPVSVDN